MKQREWVGEREKLQRMKEMEKDTRKDKKKKERESKEREINKQIKVSLEQKTTHKGPSRYKHYINPLGEKEGKTGKQPNTRTSFRVRASAEKIRVFLSFRCCKSG